MKRMFLALGVACWAAAAHGQGGVEAARAIEPRVTIEDCYAWTRANWPLVGQLGLIARSEEYSLANAAKGWLPQVAVSAQASYQSDVTSLPFDPAQLGLAGVTIPTLSRDQYGARVEITQPVWDGGAVRAGRDGVRAAADVERAGAEVGLYALRERVNGLFFGILLTGEQLGRIEVLESDLTVGLARVEALARGGVAGQADIDALRIETLRAAQQRAGIEATRRAYIEMLAALTGRELGPGTLFEKPVVAGFGAGTGDAGTMRPEMALFDAQIRGVEARGKRLDAAITPRLGLFASAGYGKPGLNMLANRFEWWGVVGARLSWNIGGLYTRRNDLRQIAADIRGVEIRREAFLVNARLDAAQKNGEIERLRTQMRHDDEIVALRESVLRAAETKMAAGTISGSDLAREINAVEAARQERLTHEIELLMAIHNLKFTTNN